MHRFLVVLLGLMATGFAQKTVRMEAIVRAQTAGDRFMGAVLVAKGDEIVFEQAYGWADVEWQVPNTTEGRFRVGSITKQFTAAAILRLQEQGRLRLDDSLAKYVPDAPESWRPITLRLLLHHTSGIASFKSLPDYAELQRAPLDLARGIERLKELPSEAPPGENYHYSNTGYLMLGYVIEQVSGQSYATFLREQFLQPLGLHDTDCDANLTILPKRVNGYTFIGGQLRNAPYIDMSVPQAAGALHSTTHDLWRWTRALFGGRVLSAESLAEMTTPGRGDYGLGVVVRTVEGRKVVEHAGNIHGFNAHLAYYPESRVTVIVLGNVNGPAPDQLAAQLGKLAHGEEVTVSTPPSRPGH